MGETLDACHMIAEKVVWSSSTQLSNCNESITASIQDDMQSAAGSKVTQHGKFVV